MYTKRCPFFLKKKCIWFYKHIYIYCMYIFAFIFLDQNNLKQLLNFFNFFKKHRVRNHAVLLVLLCGVVPGFILMRWHFWTFFLLVSWHFWTFIFTRELVFLKAFCTREVLVVSCFFSREVLVGTKPGLVFPCCVVPCRSSFSVHGFSK